MKEHVKLFLECLADNAWEIKRTDGTSLHEDELLTVLGIAYSSILGINPNNRQNLKNIVDLIKSSIKNQEQEK